MAPSARWLLDDKHRSLVTVEVPRGALNVQIDSDDLDRPVLKGLKSASPEPLQQRGAAELSGRVPVGSILIGVNELDFLQANLSFKAIKDVLQKSSHLPRTLKFHIPVDPENNVPLCQSFAPRGGPPFQEEDEEEKEEPEDVDNEKSIDDVQALKTATRLLETQDCSVPITQQEALKGELTSTNKKVEEDLLSKSDTSSAGDPIYEIHMTKKTVAASVVQDQSDKSVSRTLSEIKLDASMTSERTITSVHKPEEQSRLSIPIDIVPRSLPESLSFKTMAKLAETRHFDSDDSSDESDVSEENYQQATSGGGSWEPGKVKAISSDTSRLYPSSHPEKLSPEKPHRSSLVQPSIVSSQTDRDVSEYIKDGVKYVTVIAPPGPLGLNLDGGRLDCAVVMGFVRLSDGSKGALERAGCIVPGSVIVCINGEDVSHFSLTRVGSKIRELSRLHRTLKFRLPLSIEGKQPHDLPESSVMQRPQTSFLTEDLDKRRKLELALIMHYDKEVLSRRDCWFCINAKWMARWADFVCRGGSEPGPIVNETLLNKNWRKKVDHDAPGRADTAREGLILMKDYRVVVPFVWCLLAELHGLGEAPLLARHRMDIYAEALCDGEIRKVLEVPTPKAVVLANHMRDKCLVRSSTIC